MDSSRPGTYTITYTTTKDDDDQATTVTREIKVVGDMVVTFDVATNGGKWSDNTDASMVVTVTHPNNTVGSAMPGNPQEMGHMAYRPNPATECCPGNVNRAMGDCYPCALWVRQIAYHHFPRGAAVNNTRSRAFYIGAGCL